MNTSPDIERKKNGAAVLCVILAVLCLALAGVAWYFRQNVAAANERAAQAEAKAEEMQGYCESLIRAGGLAVDRADELLEDADEELQEFQKDAGYTFTYSGYGDEFDMYLKDTWDHTVETIQEKLP